MNKIKVLTICGSLRSNSLNRKALNFASKIAEGYEVEIKDFDLKQKPLPHFDEDMDINSDKNIIDFKKSIEESDIIMISSPEYNHSLPGVLKNAIDWGSRNKNSFSGKSTVIFGVSNGNYGTIRMQFHMRQILAALNVYVEPQPQVFIGNGNNIFDSNGNITDSKIVEQLTKLIESTIKNFKQ